MMIQPIPVYNPAIYNYSSQAASELSQSDALALGILLGSVIPFILVTVIIGLIIAHKRGYKAEIGYLILIGILSWLIFLFILFVLVLILTGLGVK